MEALEALEAMEALQALEAVEATQCNGTLYRAPDIESVELYSQIDSASKTQKCRMSESDELYAQVGCEPNTCPRTLVLEEKEPRCAVESMTR